MIGVVLSVIFLVMGMLWVFSICEMRLLSRLFLVLIFDDIMMGVLVCVLGVMMVVVNVRFRIWVGRVSFIGVNF